jgi:hypothetical protein
LGGGDVLEEWQHMGVEPVLLDAHRRGAQLVA